MTQTQPAGYLALPATDTGSAVLVLHAWWGLNDTIKAFCERLANAGFVAFAPDLYHGKITDEADEAETLSGAVFENLPQARAKLVAALSFLTERAGGDAAGVAVIGFSLGAFFALDLSVTAPDTVRSVVIFYGTRPGDYSHSTAAYLGHFAENDSFEPQSEVDSLAEALTHAGRPVTFHVYRDSGHWFFEPDRADAYNQSAASVAWDRTIAFLNGA
ncbi:MAG: dienelactone hydrolase family protein [Armatimonadetes bacterium]|nr:dienelactone hydrolase family protein [Anaerolineae bacterium]